MENKYSEIKIGGLKLLEIFAKEIRDFNKSLILYRYLYFGY